MECNILSREGAGLAKPHKHLWRQPRTHIRIQQRFHSDTDPLLYGTALGESHAGPEKPRLSSLPSPFQKRTSLSEGSAVFPPLPQTGASLISVPRGSAALATQGRYSTGPRP
ncbi:hypothetical protein AAFF_G00221810 [Aldrovandia affinis]|uniref:Uncharacterized protein n=1 Tax=Aldrovandia affinis TaxID=143900 RepID=A0AAD7W3X6_9TELE|nr:hypothetical protein AAFF_G00221810 [Aldrovandia affinis]